MGLIDTEGKSYLSNNKYFADAFNFLLYNGRQVIKPGESWDGPLSLHDMLNVEDKELLRFIPNYPVNLIAPANIDDNDFGKFHTDLGLAMKVLKYQNSKVDQILVSNEHETVDRSTAVFLNKVANLGLELEDEEGDVDMNVVMEKRDKKNEVNGAIKLMKSEGKTEKEIIERIVEIFDVTKEYVLALLSPQKS